MDSVVSNTAGYSFTSGDPTEFAAIVGPGYITAYGQMGGKAKKKKRKRSNKKTPIRRPMSKRAKKLTMRRVKSQATLYKAKKSTNKKSRTKSAKHDVIRSIESGKPLSATSKRKLSPSIRSFLSSIPDSQSSTIRFSDFKSTKRQRSKKSKVQKAGGKSCKHKMCKCSGTCKC